MAELLQAWAVQTPDALAFCFLIDGEEEGPRLTYADLDRAARAIAVTLRDAAAPGDRALLLFPPGLEFISAFFGCQYAGVVPVPAYPPRLDRVAQSWQTLANIAADCQPRVVLTGGSVGPLVAGGIGNVPSLNGVQCIVTDCLDLAAADQWHAPPPEVGTLALLQYTSGSTAEPKGVMVTHRNLMHNERMIDAAFGHPHTGHRVGVCWLPLYHDMGLIGGVLQTVFNGAACYMMSPLVLLQRPVRWLQAISRYRAYTSGGPNFAYDFCLQRIAPEETAGLDLNCWSVAAVGSETINPRTLERFAERFGPCGFRPEAFIPCYGLAEATLIVAGGPPGRRPVLATLDAAALERGQVVVTSTGPRVLVGCGRPVPGVDLLVVDPETRSRLPDGAVGEIWVAGPAVAPGYWNRAEETEHAFRAVLSDTGAGPYLRTGDLGFVHDGELFVTGRIKDLIVIRGRNYAPQDIEATVQSVHSGLRPDCGAAFEVVRDGRPRLIVVQEVDRRCRSLDVAQVIGDIREAVAARHELQVSDVRLLAFGSIPKTSSGKVQRHLCRAGYEGETLRPWKGKDA
jgi:acyl-CoA synthetase (AMP-forming)/AMP-acid ligase II